MQQDEDEFLLDNDENEFLLSDESESNPKIDYTEIKDKRSNFGKDSNLIHKLSAEKVYDLLVKNHKNNEDWNEYLKRNIYVYQVVGLQPFQDPSEEDIKRLNEKQAEWIKEASDEWLRTNQKKVEDLTAALGALCGIFSQSGRYKNEFRPALLNNQFAHLDGLIDDICKDKTVTTEERKSLIHQAKNYGLWDESSIRKDTLSKIHSEFERRKVTVNTYVSDFITYVKQLPKKQRMDFDSNREAMLNQFKELKICDALCKGETTNFTTDVLKKEMEDLLNDCELNFIPNTDLFVEEYFNRYVEDNKLNLSVSLTNEVYYSIKTVAQNQYKFTIDQWNEFIKQHNIQKEPDVIEKEKNPTVQEKLQQKVKSYRSQLESAYNNNVSIEEMEKLYKVAKAEIADNPEATTIKGYDKFNDILFKVKAKIEEDERIQNQKEEKLQKEKEKIVEATKKKRMFLLMKVFNSGIVLLIALGMIYITVHFGKKWYYAFNIKFIKLWAIAVFLIIGLNIGFILNKFKGLIICGIGGGLLGVIFSFIIIDNFLSSFIVILTILISVVAIINLIFIIINKNNLDMSKSNSKKFDN